MCAYIHWMWMSVVNECAMLCENLGWRLTIHLQSQRQPKDALAAVRQHCSLFHFEQRTYRCCLVLHFPAAG